MMSRLELGALVVALSLAVPVAGCDKKEDKKEEAKKDDKAEKADAKKDDKAEAKPEEKAEAKPEGEPKADAADAKADEGGW
jgi:hypothetical protein